jgi:hypothetical protein
MDFPRLAESLTCRFESGLVNLAITFDDVNLATGTVGKQGNLHCALVPAHCRGTMVEHFNKDDGLVGTHGEAVGKCHVIKWFASLLKKCLTLVLSSNQSVHRHPASGACW